MAKAIQLVLILIPSCFHPDVHQRGGVGWGGACFPKADAHFAIAVAFRTVLFLGISSADLNYTPIYR